MDDLSFLDDWIKPPKQDIELSPSLGFLKDWVNPPTPASPSARLFQERMDYEDAKKENPSSPLQDVSKYLMERSLLFGSAIYGRGREANAQQAAKQVEAGNASSEDYAAVFRSEDRQKAEKEKSTGRAILDAAASLPAMLGEAAIGGPIAKGALGLAGMTAGKTVLGQGLRQGAVMATATPAMPSLWLEESQRRAGKNGGEWTDPENLAPALAQGAITNFVLGQVGKFAPAVGSKVPTLLGRTAATAGAGAVIMPAEQQLADAVSSRISEDLNDKYKIDTRYGTIGHLMRGETNEALKSVAVQAVLAAGYATFHGREAKPVEAFKDLADDLAKKGYSRQKAAEIIQKDVGGLAEDIKAGRDVTKEIEGLPEGKVRDYVQSLADAAKPSEKTTEDVSDHTDSHRLTPPDAIKPPEAAPADQTAPPAPEGEIASQSKPQEAEPAKNTDLPPDIQDAISRLERRSNDKGPPTGLVERRQVKGAKLANPERVTAENAKGEEIFHLSKFGENNYRFRIHDAEGAEQGRVNVGIDPKNPTTLEVPIAFLHGMEFGEGAGVAPLGAQTMPILRQLAAVFPEAKNVKFKIADVAQSATRQDTPRARKAGQVKTWSLDRFRRPQEQAAEPPKPESGQGPIRLNASPPKAEARNPIEPPKPEPKPDVTALARAEVSKDRLLRGEEAVVKAASKSDPELWEAAKRDRAQDPTSTDRIVADILSNKPVDPDKAAPHLLQKRIELNNAEKSILAKGGDPEAVRRSLEDVRAEMNKVDVAVDRLGSKLGRGLRFYRVLAAEDYSLSGMLGRATVDNKGPLTPDQTKKIEEMAKRIDELNDRLDLYRNEPVVIPPADTPARSIWDRAKDFLGGLFKLPESKKKDSKAWDWADKLEKNATDELMKKFGPNSLYSGFDPAAIPLLAKYTAAKIVKSGLTFADFSKRITSKFGDEVRPHLDAIWSQAKKLASQPMDQKDHEIAIEKEKENYDNYREEIKRSKFTTGRKVWEGVKETGNVIRLWETAADLSAMLRQGGLYTFGRPIKALTDTLPKMLRAVLSERQYDRRQYDLMHSKDGIQFMQNGGFLSEPGKLNGKEEAFISRLLSKRPTKADWKNPLKAPLNVVREIVSGSERAYTSFLNEARLELFRSMRDTAFRDGRLTKEEAGKLATFTNDWTGRATLPGQAEKSAAWLANFAFSPRYLWSRVRVLSGVNLAGGTMATRKAIAKEYARSAMGLTLFYGAVAASNEDAKVEWDPRSSDFGKIRFGSFRLDPLTGLSQLGVLLTRLTTGEFKSTETGKAYDLRKPTFELRKPLPPNNNPGKMTMAKVITSFGRNKAAPGPGMVYDKLTGTQPAKDTPPTWKDLAAQALIPISVKDVYDAMRDQKFPRSAALSVLAILGMGTQLHEPRAKK